MYCTVTTCGCMERYKYLLYTLVAMPSAITLFMCVCVFFLSQIYDTMAEIDLLPQWQQVHQYHQLWWLCHTLLTLQQVSMDKWSVCFLLWFIWLVYFTCTFAVCLFKHFHINKRILSSNFCLFSSSCIFHKADSYGCCKAMSCSLKLVNPTVVKRGRERNWMPWYVCQENNKARWTYWYWDPLKTAWWLWSI